MPIFDNNTSLVASLAVREDSNGNIFRHAKAGAALTALKAYALTASTTGWVAKAFSASPVSVTGCITRVIVPLAAVTSGDTFWGQTGGILAGVDVTTSIDASSNKYVELVANGATAIEANPTKTSIFGYCTDADNDNDHDLFLFDREIVVAAS